MAEGRDYLTVEEAAEFLQRSVPTVWRLIKHHSLQTFRRPLDRRTYLRRADLERLSGVFEPRQREG